MRYMNKCLCLVLLILCATVVSAWSSDANAIKLRMKARLPDIVALKAQGIVGEGNTGYLGFVTQNRKGQNLVNQENADRKRIYNAIAKQQKVSVDLVEKRRAIQLAQQAKPGEYIQKSDGGWQRK